jgi:hypothetical protein
MLFTCFAFRLTPKKVRELLLVALNSAYEVPVTELLSEDDIIEELVASDEEEVPSEESVPGEQ